MWDIPSPKELIRTISNHHPESVLDVGCGYGRHLIQIVDHFNAEGCDLSNELLAKVPNGIKVFKADVVLDSLPRTWDVVYSWCVMMYFSDDEMHSAMTHMDNAANKKVIIWDWRHVCDRMRELYPSDKFEYHVLPLSG
jgi:SAM-dependent methyltransferase